jgi:ribosome-associated protein
MFPSAITQGGEVLLFGDEHRSQSMNLEAVRQRLKSMVLSARRPPRARRATQPSRGAKQRRRDEKRRRGLLKKQRRTGFD